MDPTITSDRCPDDHVSSGFFVQPDRKPHLSGTIRGIEATESNVDDCAALLRRYIVGYAGQYEDTIGDARLAM